MLVREDGLVGEDELVFGVVYIDGNGIFREINVCPLVFAIDLLGIFHTVIGAFENAEISGKERILNISDGALGFGFSQNRHGVSSQVFSRLCELKITG